MQEAYRKAVQTILKAMDRARDIRLAGLREAYKRAKTDLDARHHPGRVSAVSDLTERWDRFNIDNQGRERPGWAAAVLSSLADAGTYGFSDDTMAASVVRLTREERELLMAIEYRLRGRLGETQADGEPLDVLGDVLLQYAMKKIQEP